MAILICPECGGNVSSMAAFCPHCGITIENIEKEIERKSVLVIPDEAEYYDTNLIDTTYLKKVILPIELENMGEIFQKVGYNGWKYNAEFEYYGQNAVGDWEQLNEQFDCARRMNDGNLLFKCHKQFAIDYKKSSSWFVDHRYHYYAVGRFYLDSFGFENLSIEKNIQKAFYWLKLAAHKCESLPYVEGEELPPNGFYGYPYPEACYVLGSTYAKGIDVERNFELAEYYLSLGEEVGRVEFFLSEKEKEMAELCSNLLNFLYMEEKTTEWYLWNAIFGIYDVED